MLPAEKFEELPSSSLNLHFSTILGTIIKCEQCSGITMESGTSVKITLNIFAVFAVVLLWNVETVSETSAPTILKS